MSTEDFENTGPLQFAKGSVYYLNSDKSPSYELIAQKNTSSLTGFQAADAIHKEHVGETVLTIGKDSTIRITFAEPVTQFSWKYYLENPDSNFTIKVATEDGLEDYKDTRVTPVVDVMLGDTILKSIEISATAAGTLNIDSLSWQSAGKATH